MSARHATRHKPVVETKTTEAHVTGEGMHWPAQTLYRYRCPCGWEGAAWYASKARARNHYDQHVVQAAER